MPKNQKIVGLILALVIGLAMAGCAGGGECDRCDDDADCDKGLTCELFTNGSIAALCAKRGTKTCTVTATPFTRR